MKSYFTRTVSAGVLAVSLGVLPLTLPAQAQVRTVPRTDTDAVRVYDRDGFDWGWLGLIGLLGLAGLAGKRREEEPTRYRDPNTPSATSYRD
jgi:hypothetical protein